MIFVWLPVVMANGQHGNPSSVVVESLGQWLEQARKGMAGFRPDTCKNIIEVEITDLGEEYYACSYRVDGPGMIRISDTEWIFLVPSSSHDNPEVGDITLAMDQKKRFYMNEGNICGGIIHFQTHDRFELTKSRQFFKYFVSDTNSVRWVRE